jgi:Spy/CpxP family protein refolding chaperone
MTSVKRYALISAIVFGAYLPEGGFAQAPLPPLGGFAQMKSAAPVGKAANSGTWWRDPEWVNALNLTAEQQRKMDDVFQQYRLKLVDLNGNLQKEELILEPLIENMRSGDEARVLAQIDRIAEARAELEKANSRMLLAIRQALTADQWAKVSASNSKEKSKAAPADPALNSKAKVLKEGVEPVKVPKKLN